MTGARFYMIYTTIFYLLFLFLFLLLLFAFCLLLSFLNQQEKIVIKSVCLKWVMYISGIGIRITSSTAWTMIAVHTIRGQIPLGGSMIDDLLWFYYYCKQFQKFIKFFFPWHFNAWSRSIIASKLSVLERIISEMLTKKNLNR